MKKPLLPLLILLSTLAGCHSTPKDERYNNMTPNEIYKQGVEHVRKENFTVAVEDFEALESRYPFGEYADKAQLGAIYAQYQNEEYAAALPAVERFIRMYPRHPHVDYAYYMKGLIHFSESMGSITKYLPMERHERDTTPVKKALEDFQNLVNLFPHSVYVPDAKQRIIYLRNLLAQSELTAANFYYKKGAYLAAATRANYVISNLPQTPNTPEALVIMVKAYRKLKLDGLANDAYRVLQLNYPHSSLLRELQ